MRAKHIKRGFSLVILFIAFTAGVYSQRADVMEWYRQITVQPLPEAVGYEEIVKNIEEVTPVIEDIEKEEDFVEEVQDEIILEIKKDVIVEDVPVETIEEEVTEVENALPSSVNLAVPFTSQAPHGSWGEPYQEACEEASVYMVHSYYEGVPAGPIPADTADLDLLNIVAFEKELFGYYEDTTAEQTGMFAEMMFGHAYTLIEDPTVEDIKMQLAAGRPVLVPAAGRLLGNPYFTAPGPVYHMLVIRGYTEAGQFIVNDPGTYRGESFVYEADTLLYAMHDWNDGDEITGGRKVVLVLNP